MSAIAKGGHAELKEAYLVCETDAEVVAARAAAEKLCGGALHEGMATPTTARPRCPDASALSDGGGKPGEPADGATTRRRSDPEGHGGDPLRGVRGPAVTGGGTPPAPNEVRVVVLRGRGLPAKDGPGIVARLRDKHAQGHVRPAVRIALADEAVTPSVRLKDGRPRLVARRRRRRRPDRTARNRRVLRALGAVPRGGRAPSPRAPRAREAAKARRKRGGADEPAAGGGAGRARRRARHRR